MADNAENLDAIIEDAERLLRDEDVVISSTVEELATTVAEAIETPSPDASELTQEEEVVSHSEKSRLGRKVTRLEKTLGEIKSALDFLKERSAGPPPEEDEEPDLPENPTADEIREFVKKDRERFAKNLKQEAANEIRQANEKSQKYAEEYTRLIENTLDPEDDADLWSMMTDAKDLKYNQVITRDAKEDFLINYRNATKSLLNKSKPAKTLVHGKSPKVSTAVNVPNSALIVAVKTIDRNKLSDTERSLAQMFSDDELANMGIG